MKCSRRIVAGSAIDSKYTPSTHTCTVHGFGIDTDLQENGGSNTDDDLLHAFTYVSGSQWKVAVNLRHGTSGCVAWATVVCWKHSSFEYDDYYYTIDKPSSWLSTSTK